MTLFETPEVFGKQGVSYRVIGKDERKEIRKLSFKAGDKKVWYMEEGQEPAKPYLVSLLLAEQHQRAVPALADSAKARRCLASGILEKPAEQANRKRPLAIVQCGIEKGDWEVPVLPSRAAETCPCKAC